jgi:hypothetical protein
VEFLGEVRDRSICTREPLQDAASGGVRDRGERGIKVGANKLNHVVQFVAYGLAACKGWPGWEDALPPEGDSDIVIVDAGEAKVGPEAAAKAWALFRPAALARA